MKRRAPIARRTPPRRGKRPRSRQPKALGTYRERVKYLNKLWRGLIRLKAPDGLCQVCRKRAWSDAMHLFPKGYYPALRFEVWNGWMGCRTCHRRIDADAEAKRQFAERMLGAERYELYRLRAASATKTDLTLVRLELEGLTRAAGAEVEGAV